jgi:phosphate transport system permease protein
MLAPVEAATTTPGGADALRTGKRRTGDRIGDLLLYGLTAGASLGAMVLVALIVYEIVQLAWPAMTHLGVPFLWRTVWDPVHESFGALDFVYGTVYTSFVALLIAAPISIAIGLYLSELAPGAVRGPVGTLVELLAAVPSVVIGLWGILVLGPVIQHPVGSWLGKVLGWTPFFSGSPRDVGMLSAVVVLSIMMVPITSSISRELFLTVPRDLKEAAFGLGLTRWEMVRGVVLPYTRSGVLAAVILGLGRALGEAIAVTQVIGGHPAHHLSLFDSGDTLASRLANEFYGATTSLEKASLAYLGAILLVITLLTNVTAQILVHRFDPLRERK